MASPSLEEKLSTWTYARKPRGPPPVHQQERQSVTGVPMPCVRLIPAYAYPAFFDQAAFATTISARVALLNAFPSQHDLLT